MICQKCNDGCFLQPNDWKCNKCKANLNISEVKDINEEAYKEAKIILNDMSKWTVEGFEEYLTKYSKKLHSNHVLNVSIKNKLAGFYGKLQVGWSSINSIFFQSVSTSKRTQGGFLIFNHLNRLHSLIDD